MNTVGTGSDAKNLVTNGNKLIVYDGEKVFDVYRDNFSLENYIFRKIAKT